MGRTISYRCHQQFHLTFSEYCIRRVWYCSNWIKDSRTGKMVKKKSLEKRAKKKVFVCGLFWAIERVFQFFSLLPGIAIVALILQAFYAVCELCTEQGGGGWGYCLRHWKNLDDEFWALQTFLNTFCSSSGQECATTLNNLNCCF